MERRHLLSRMGALCAATLLPGWTACTPALPLKVAIHPWIGYETLRLARTFHWLPDSVQLCETKDLAGSSSAIERGDVDAACLTLDEVLRVRAIGVPLTVVLVFDVSNGADAVIAKPPVLRLSDLAGKRIGMEAGALGMLMLVKLLEASGLPPAAVTVADVPSEQQVQAWRNGTIDVAITYEPTATLLERAGGHRLFDSRQVPEMIFDVLALRSDRLSGHQGALHALLAGHFRGLTHLLTQREDATYRIATSQDISTAEVRQAMTGVILPSLEANREYLGLENARLTQAAGSLSRLMLGNGLIPRADDLAGLSSAAWLPPREGD